MPLNDQTDDSELVRDAVGGSRDALDVLLRRHEADIYGLAIRMLWEPRDAEDATQEVLLKIATRLGSFRGESAFRTWAYRIAANHLVSIRRSKAEETIRGFDCYGRALAAVPLEAIADDAVHGPEQAVLAHEVKVGCTVGMLLCLDREQRIAFVLGEIFQLPDAAGAEVLGIGRDNFRQRLARARGQLRAFLQGNCGLADPRNGCRCARKMQGFIRAGLVDPTSLRFAAAHRTAVERLAPRRASELDAWFGASLEAIYRGEALRPARDLVAAATAILRSSDAERLLSAPASARE
jgi:RNA polymerase sigma factor (sigma-70 family)